MFEFNFLLSAPNHRLAMISYVEYCRGFSSPSGNDLLDQLSTTTYHTSAQKHIENIGKIFRYQFDTDIYRRASNSSINVSPDLKVHASAIATDLSGQITISIGLLYALEDMWQCVVSDANTDLHLYGGIPSGTNNDVTRDVKFFHDLDQFRFCDYSFLNDINISSEEMARMAMEVYECDYSKALEMARLYKNNIQLGKWFTGVSKMISVDRDRIELGYFLSDLSLQWILAHEDAHIYCGHTAVFSKIGVSPSELANDDIDFLELARSRASISLGGFDYPFIRTLSELYADENACMRIVDTYCRCESFRAYPFLNQGVLALIEEYANEGTHLNEKEARVIVIARICITAAVGSILLFQRHIEKKNIDSDEYPDVSIRLANIVKTTLERIQGRIINFDDVSEYFQSPNERAKAILNLGISTDIYVLTWNLFFHPTLMLDPDFKSNNIRLARHLTTLDDRSRTLKLIHESSFYTDLSIKDQKSIRNIAGFLHQMEILYAVELLRSQFYSVFSEVFKLSHYSSFPNLRDRLEDTYYRLEAESEILKIACDLVLGIRGDDEASMRVLGRLLNDNDSVKKFFRSSALK